MKTASNIGFIFNDDYQHDYNVIIYSFIGDVSKVDKYA